MAGAYRRSDCAASCRRFHSVDSQSSFDKLQSILQPRLEEYWQMLQPIFLNEERYTISAVVIPFRTVFFRRRFGTAGNLFSAFSQLEACSQISLRTEDRIGRTSDLSRKELAEQFYPVIGGAQRRAEEVHRSGWHIPEDDLSKPPVARWMTYQEDDTQIETTLSRQSSFSGR